MPSNSSANGMNRADESLRTSAGAPIFQPVLDDVYELSTVAPTLADTAHRRRLAPEAVVALDWHNDMSRLIPDINDQIDAAADDRARGVIIRRLRRALTAPDDHEAPARRDKAK